MKQKQKNMEDIIFTIIRNNIPLRKSISEYLGVTETTVYGHAKRKAPKLNDFIVVKIIMKHTGKTEKEIFTPETLKCIR